MSALFFQNGVSIGTNAGWCGYTGSNNYVVRYSFDTGAAGADSLSLVLSDIYYGSAAGSQSFGLRVSESSVAYANARNIVPDSNYAVMSYTEGSGYGCVLTAGGLNLRPDSRYYIFVFVATDGAEYYSGWNCTNPAISLSGSYSPPGGAISALTPSVTTQSPVSLLLNSPQPYHVASFYFGETLLGHSEVFATSLSHICPRDWMKTDTGARSMEIRVSVQGYSDALCSKVSGEAMEGSFILRPDSFMRPLIPADALNAVAVNQNVQGDIDGFISGVSRARVSFDTEQISLESCAGATVTGFALSYGGERVESTEPQLETGVLSGETVINCIVIDSRGREGSLSLSISPQPYVPPSLSEVEALRCDGEGLEEELGEFFRIRAESSCTELDGKNSCSVSVQIRPAGGEWGPESELTGFESGVWSHQWESPAVLGGALQGDSYKLALTVRDRLGVASRYTIDLYHQTWAMKFNEKGTALGLGMEPTVENALQLPEGWKLYTGGIVLSERSYGVLEPEEAVSSPAEGQLYFLISD